MINEKKNMCIHKTKRLQQDPPVVRYSKVRPTHVACDDVWFHQV